MNAWAKRGLQAAVFTGGMLALGAGIASANECCPDRPTPPLAASLSVPVHICDNVVGAPGGPYATPCVDQTLSTDDVLAKAGPLLAPTGPAALPIRAGLADRVLRGNRGHINVVVPLDVSGNALAAAGQAYAASSSGVAYHRPDPVYTDGSAGPLAGNVVAADWVAPVAFTGNAGSVLGSAGADSTTSTDASSGGDVYTDGVGGPVSGNVLTPAFATPVQFSGNALAAPGGTAAAGGSQSVGATAGGDAGTTGEGSPLSGNVGSGPLALPVQFNGNAIAWGGRAQSQARAVADATAAGDVVSNGSQTEGSGNIAAPAVAGPAAIAGNAISGVGRAQTAGTQQTTATAGGDYGTSGRHGVLAGNIASPAGAVPAQALGNGVAWIGKSDAAYADSTASTAGGKHSTTGNGGLGAGHVASVPVAGPAQIASNGVIWMAGTSTDGSTDTQTTAGGDSATNGDHGLASGGVGDLPVAMPVQGFGNGVAWTGEAAARHRNSVAAFAGGDSYTGADSSVLGGLMASGPLAGPVEVFGNGGSWMGTAAGSGSSVSFVDAGGVQDSSGSDAIGSGEIAQLPMSLPVRGMGNGASWIGDAEASASSELFSVAGGPSDSDGDGGLLSSNVATAPVAGPVEVFGNAFAWFSNVSGAADSHTASTAGGSVDATGTNGSGSGNVAAAPLALPAQGFGDAVSWFGAADAAATNTTTTTAGGSADTSGTNGTLGGNVAQLPALAAAQPFGLGAGWIADSSAAAESESVVASGGPVTTDGSDASFSGDIASIPVGALGQAFAGAFGITGGTGDSYGSNATAAFAGDSTSTAGSGVLDGADLQYPLGAAVQPYDMPVEVLGDALTSASNDTVLATGGSAPLVDVPVTGSPVPPLPDVPVLPLPDSPVLPPVPQLPGGSGTRSLESGARSLESDIPATSGVPGLDGEPGLDALPVDLVPGIEGLPPLPGLDGAPGLDPLTLPNIDSTSLTGLDGFGLPAVGSLPPVPELPNLDGLDSLPTLPDLPDPDGGTLPSLDGVSVPSLDALLSLDGVSVPGLDLDALPSSDGVSVPASDGLLLVLEGLLGGGAVPSVPSADGLALPAVDALPGLDALLVGDGAGLPGVDALPGLVRLSVLGWLLDVGALPATDGLTVPGSEAVPGVDGLPGTADLPAADGAMLPSLPTMDGLPGEGLPAASSLPGRSGAAPTPMPLEVPVVGALPVGDEPAFGALSGFDMLRDLSMGLAGLADLPNVQE